MHTEGVFLFVEFGILAKLMAHGHSGRNHFAISPLWFNVMVDGAETVQVTDKDFRENPTQFSFGANLTAL
jgi:hypothetical protein